MTWLTRLRSSLRPARAAAAAAVLCVVGVAAARFRARQAAGTGQLLVLTQLSGVTAPCGCTSRPLGGLDRIATLHAKLQRQHPSALVSVGDTFFDPPPHAAPLLGHRRATANIIGAWLGTLAPAWAAVGPADEAGALEAGAPWASQALALAAAGAEESVVVSKRQAVGEHDVGLLAVRASVPAHVVTAEALSGAAQALRADGAHGVVLLWPHGVAAARRNLEALSGIDVVLSGNDGPPAAPERLGSAVLLGGGHKGEYLGVLRLQAGGATSMGEWTFNDGGEMVRKPLRQQRERFAAEAGRLADGAAKQARLARVAALDAQLAEAEQAQTQQSAANGVRVAWDVRPIEESVAQAAWATTLLAHYNDALCDMAMKETGARACPPAGHPSAQYVGTQTCVGCHAEAAAVHAGTAHAHAWATLTTAHKACDVSCVGCHVVGWEQPGGFCHLAESAPFQNVGCESCHGPGAGHAQQPLDRSQWAPSFVRNTPESTCRGCHNAEHSDQFDFATYRPRILGPGHGAPLP